MADIPNPNKIFKTFIDSSPSGPILDPIFWKDIFSRLAETSFRAGAGALGAPIDLTTMAMRPLGYNVPPEKVVGGSEWINKQMENAGILSTARNPTAEFLAGFLTPDPTDIVKLGAMTFPVVGKKIISETENLIPQKTFYHGSPKIIKEIKPSGTFEGVFASPERSVAASHGDVIHKVQIPEQSILTDYDLNYSIDFDKTKDALKKSMPWLDDDDLDLAWKAVIEDKANDLDANDLERIMKTDPDEAVWEAQKLRGQVAKNLGYKAVEMNDEHGTSYLILPGSKIDLD